MPRTVPKLLTPGRIALKLHVPLHRVLYVLQTRAQFKPAARAGTLRLYRERDIPLIQAELARIDARRRPEVSNG